MPVREAHRQVAAIVLEVASRHGFALAGGNALMMHEVIDRHTADVDIFTNEVGGVEAVAAKVEDALAAAGFAVDRTDKTGGLTEAFPGMGEGLAEWALTSPTGEKVQLQMSYFYRVNRPVIMEVGPVLDLDDVAAGKTAAFASRAVARDFVDVAALLNHYSPAELIALARRQDPGLREEDFPAAAQRLDQTPDTAFAQRYRLLPDIIAWIREQFRDWPR